MGFYKTCATVSLQIFLSVFLGGELAQWVKLFLYKHKDWSLDLQHPQVPSGHRSMPAIPVQKQRERLVKLISSRFHGKPCLSK